MLAVHVEHLPDLEALRARAEPFGDELPIEGASMAVGDASLADEEEFRNNLGNLGQGVVEHRAARISLTGDGHARAAIARVGGAAVLVVIEIH